MWSIAFTLTDVDLHDILHYIAGNDGCASLLADVEVPAAGARGQAEADLRGRGRRRGQVRRRLRHRPARRRGEALTVVNAQP